MILAHPFERTMKKVIGIAPLIIALILGTCLSSQAQIVMAQPIQIDGGFNNYMYSFNKGKQNTEIQQNHLQSDEVYRNSSTTKNVDQIKYNYGVVLIDYETLYKVCTFKENKETGLYSGSYYRKLVSCNRNSDEIFKNLN
ncbi:MAG: hypothetical protein C0591_07885 [Marinilabiliales bacterium]|nr:MAG: hypothetical protein C0591_07885 [Marinilabiliales bacterium]